jgi:predicted DNA-binding protein
VRHPTSIKLDDGLYKRTNLAAARLGLSSSEFIRSAMWAALETFAENDPVMARVFLAMDELERQDETEASPELPSAVAAH